MGGSLNGRSPFLPIAVTGFDLSSMSHVNDELREDGSTSFGVSRAAIASDSDSTTELAVIGVST